MWEVRRGLANLVVGLVSPKKFNFVRYGRFSVEVFEKLRFGGMLVLGGQSAKMVGFRVGIVVGTSWKVGMNFRRCVRGRVWSYRVLRIPWWP